MSLFIFSLILNVVDAIVPQCNSKWKRQTYTHLEEITTNCGLW